MKRVLRVVPTAMSLAMASDNVKFVKKKHKGVHDFTGQGVKNIVGASMTNEVAKFID